MLGLRLLAVSAYSANCISRPIRLELQRTGCHIEMTCPQAIWTDNFMGLKHTYLALALSLAATSFASANEKPTYPDLPGVKSQQQQATNPVPQNCSSELVTPHYAGRPRGLPVRVYNCSNGSVSYGGTLTPLGLQRHPDPYSHGEGPVKPLGSLE
jgi:hypothetical protein